jgi:hypothetical protein
LHVDLRLHAQKELPLHSLHCFLILSCLHFCALILTYFEFVEEDKEDEDIEINLIGSDKYNKEEEVEIKDEDEEYDEDEEDDNSYWYLLAL